MDLWARVPGLDKNTCYDKLTFLLLLLSSVGYILFLANVSVVTGATGGDVGGGGGGGEVVSNGMVPVSGTAYSYAESETQTVPTW